MTTAHPQMAASAGPDPILERVDVDGVVGATIARIRMVQRYRNASPENVELVYTFPLPPQSALLDVAVELGKKRYRGTVVSKAIAEERYEDAMDKGDTALLVERPEPGLCVMNLGNLMAGESASVELEFAMLLDWRHNRLRLSLPMTLAPRYDEEHGRLEPQQQPAMDLLVERPFSLQLRLSSDFFGAKVSSPTHSVISMATESGMTIELQRKEAWMDRDFVLLAERAVAPVPRAWAAPDGDGHVTYATVQIPSSDDARPPRDVKIVLDCSGSMAGDSIALARVGVRKLLEQLRPDDRFGLVAFGSEPRQWARKMSEASETNLEAASAWVRERQADMGGTEMGAALLAAMAIKGVREPCDIFLITDGQVGRTEEIAEKADRTGHRLFVVGVGAAPQQDLLLRLAERTGGSIEWVTPREDMASAIHRLFTRLIEQPVDGFQVVCDDAVEWLVRKPSGTLYGGDTVHLFLRSAVAPQAVRVEWRDGAGRPVAHELPLREIEDASLASALPRVGASVRIRELELAGTSPQALQLAERYQLVTRDASYVLAIERAEKGSELPVTVRVPHMLAAGWGGTSTLGVSADMCLRLDLGDTVRASLSRHVVDDVPRFVAQIRQHYRAAVAEPRIAESIAELESLGLPSGVPERLRELANTFSERVVVASFWAVVLERAGDWGLTRQLCRFLRRAARGADSSAIASIRPLLDGAVSREALGEWLTE